MARYKRSYSGYSSKSGYKRKRYSTDYSRAKGQFKAASRGNDSLSFVVQSNHVFTATYDPQDQSGVAAVNVWDVLNRNSNFSSLKKMYDQVKIDGIKVKLSVTNAIIQLINQNAVNNYTIYTAWDKTGLSPNQVRFYHAVGEGPGARFDEILPGEYDNEAVSAWKTRIGSAIVNNSTAKKSILNNFQRWGSNISCYPSLIYEKGQYVQTGDIKQFCTTPNGNTLISTTTDVYDNRRVIDLLADGNPVVPFESTAVRFKPILLVGVFQNAVDPATGNVTQYGAIQGSVIFNGEWSISCTFRNLKGTLDEQAGNQNEEDGQPVNPDNLQRNRIEIGLNERALDQGMNLDDENDFPPNPWNNVNNNLNMNVNNRSLTRSANSNANAVRDGNNGDGVPYNRNNYIDINNLLDSQYVVRNPLQANYATSFRIYLPSHQDVTPLDVDQIEWVNKYRKTADDAEDWGDDSTVVVDGDEATKTDKLSKDDFTPVAENGTISIQPGQSVLIRMGNKIVNFANDVTSGVVKTVQVAQACYVAYQTVKAGWQVFSSLYNLFTNPWSTIANVAGKAIATGSTWLLPAANHYLLTYDGLSESTSTQDNNRNLRDGANTNTTVYNCWTVLHTGSNGVFRLFE